MAILRRIMNTLLMLSDYLHKLLPYHTSERHHQHHQFSYHHSWWISWSADCSKSWDEIELRNVWIASQNTHNMAMMMNNWGHRIYYSVLFWVGWLAGDSFSFSFVMEWLRMLLILCLCLLMFATTNLTTLRHRDAIATAPLRERKHNLWKIEKYLNWIEMKRKKARKRWNKNERN